MAYELWSQDVFSAGELSPYMYARASVSQYYNGMKTAQNVLTYPTGAAGKRFGTLYNSVLSGFTTPYEIFFQTFQYLDECVYQLLFKPGFVDIFLEGLLVATVVTGLNGESTYNLCYTVLGRKFRVTGQGFAPYDLQRAPNAGNVIVSAASDIFTLTTPVTAGLVYPIQITTSGALPVTVPQINAGVTYFIKTLTTTTAALYRTSYDAKFDLNRFTISTNGSGTNTLFIQNTWSFTNTDFKNLPVYDFNGGYDALTFTPSAVSGNAVTMTISGAYAPMTSVYVGGAFVGNGGIGRITGVTSTTLFTVSVQQPFNNTDPILGSSSFLAEPAWSTLRGFPQKCSSYQNRALFANTTSLPNGFWASTINDYADFNDLETDDDSAISWFPTSNDINFIRFIVPYRSITVHTNSGIYSSPLSEINAITPSTFSLQLQDSTPADVLQPQAIDNQIIVLSGNDAHTMLWDGINNAYTSDIVSVISEQLIRSPVDEAAFADLHRAGSRYVFIINENGSMAIFQTLLSQDVHGFTPAILEQSYGDAQFRQVSTSASGRAWFITERDIASNLPSIALTANTSNTLTAVASNFSTTEPLAITFTHSGVIPTSSPQIAIDTYYWAIGVTANTFKAYLNQEDALAGVNEITYSDYGTGSNVIPWPLVQTFFLEELTQDTYLDCAVYYSGSPTDTVTGCSQFNAQNIKMVGDGFGFEGQGIGGEVVFEAHGSTVEVSEAYIGFPIRLVIEPMPLSMATGTNIKSTALVQPKHIRHVKFMFNNTIGGTINGVPIALKPFDQVSIGEPPIPARGIFEMSIQKAWDDFNNPSFTIEHDEPFNIELLGVFYGVDV